MKYLLDVNALLAIALTDHEFHARVALWASALPPHSLATCSISELGFVRVLAKAPAYSLEVSQAAALLSRLKKAMNISLLSDGSDVSQLPSWVKTANQVTDGHLLQLARGHGMQLATLDTRIPGAYLVPHPR